MGNGTSPIYSAPGPRESLALRQGPRSAVREALQAARARTLQLAQDYRAALGSEPRVPYASGLNPPLWELGHIAWFQEWWIARNPERHRGAAADPEVARPASLLAKADAWYDSSRVAHRSRWELSLPDAAGTAAYLEASLHGTLERLDALPEQADDAALYFFRLVAAHEQMHAEAAVYMAESLGIPIAESSSPPLAPHGGELQVRAQVFRVGSDEDGFAFDNELRAHEVELPPFAIDAEPLTWGAFLPFVEAGGYEEGPWWSREGRAWLETQANRRPAALRRSASGWERVRQGGWQPLREDEVAVHLNAHEAEAWCRWAGRRLPTEAEWECAAFQAPGFRWGQVWEWTASRFEAYAGFTPHPYSDYSQPWFGSRRVLRGAAPATAAALAHARYRNFFEPQRRDIFSGFRTVRVG
jgi:gamma-glutamyl hercynylcysteine S-oxide synthase